MYEYLDKNLESVLKKTSTLFNNSRLRLLNIDEINVNNTEDANKEINSLFRKLKKQATDFFDDELDDVAERLGKDRSMFVLGKYLDAYNPVLMYVFLNEFLRKRERYKEAVISNGNMNSPDMMAYMKSNINNWNRQIENTATYIEFEATKEAYLDDGFEYVIWHSEQDNKVCATCNDLDGQIFKIDECPELQHIGCRCWIEPIVKDSDSIYHNYDISEKSANASASNNKNINNYSSYAGGKSRQLRTDKIIEAIINTTEPIYMFDDDIFRINYNRVPIKKDYYDIVAHGNKKTIDVFGVKTDAKTFANGIKQRSDYHGQKIRLLSCKTGMLEDGFAQELANYLNVDVEAPNNLIWADVNGKLTIGKTSKENTGDWVLFTPIYR